MRVEYGENIRKTRVGEFALEDERIEGFKKDNGPCLHPRKIATKTHSIFSQGKLCNLERMTRDRLRKKEETKTCLLFSFSSSLECSDFLADMKIHSL